MNKEQRHIEIFEGTKACGVRLAFINKLATLINFRVAFFMPKLEETTN